jgi:membrane peptidoglycan carboxypeptidase
VRGRVEGGARDVYTTLDWRLQHAANEAVRSAVAKVDQTLRKNGAALPPNQPQVALVAMDPHTGEIKAFVGGRNYAASQIDHALAKAARRHLQDYRSFGVCVSVLMDVDHGLQNLR